VCDEDDIAAVVAGRPVDADALYDARERRAASEFDVADRDVELVRRRYCGRAIASRP